MIDTAVLHKALVQAVNLIAEYVESNLPNGWRLRLVSTSQESWVELEDPECEDVDFVGDYCAIADACSCAKEMDGKI